MLRTGTRLDPLPKDSYKVHRTATAPSIVVV